jgi:hypothetical protein
MKLNPAKESLRKFSETMRITLLLWLLCMILGFEAQAQNWSFETGDLRNWTPIGTAFSNQPTLGDNVAARTSGTRVGQVGNYWIGTYENRHTSADPAGQVQGDGPTGQLISSEFDIANTETPQLSFLIGGGNDFNRLRVELLVRIRPGEPLPPAIVGILGIGERVRLRDGEYFVGVHSTGRNRESMRREVWELGTYRGRRARIRIKDDSTRSWGHINVDDFQFTGSSSAPTRIHVTNHLGANVEGAEIYVNGGNVGVTDASGNLSLGPLTTADDIIARKRVFEHRSHRANHSAGSSQNWNYRVYNTSAQVNNDGTITSHPVTNPAVTQELQLSLNNTTIGLHLVASVEWDATPGELFDIRDNKIIPASEFLYNATDGQFFIEQVELVDDAALWDDADYRIYTNWSLRANADGDRFNGGCFLCGNGWMDMSRTNDALVYIHEFGHYGFDLRDEYADGSGGGLDPNVNCTGNVDASNCMAGTDSTIVDFGTFQPKASCIMWVQNCTSKLCSHRPENPHAARTRQGGTSCWTRIADKFRDIERERSFFVRWALQTPDTRRAIVGTLPTLLSGWRPRVTIDNRLRASLCQPFEVRVTSNFDGQLAGNAEVWNRTFYDQNILEGKTTVDDTNTPENEAGRITVTGVHVGDRISSGGEPFVVRDCTRVSLDGRPSDAPFNGLQLASLRPVSLGAEPMISMEAFDPFVFMQQKDVRELKVTPAAFEFQISFEPTAVAGQALIRARAGAELKSAPQIEFSLVGSTKIQMVEMRFDSATRTYVGVVNQLPFDTQATVQAIAIDKASRSVTRNVSVSFSPVVPNVETDLFSADGQLSLTIPVGALPGGTRVGIGSNAFPTPSISEGAEILSGPFNVIASTGRRLNKPAILRFQLPPQAGKRSATSMFDPKSFEVLHYNPETERWEKAGGTLLEAVAIVTLPISELGAYVLTARRLTAPTTTQKFKVTGISLLASPSKYQGSCPAIINFNGVIETNGQGTVQYTFVRNDGATSPVQTLIFKSAGKLPVSNTWTIGGTSLPSYSGWQAVKVLLPTAMESDKAEFAIQCSK